MLESLLNLLEFSATELAMVGSVVFLASVVRGFSGFALSALVMAGLALTIQPSALLPICMMLELAASVLMVRGGIQNANMRIAWGLTITCAIGTPMGLYITASVSPDASRLLALALILVFAMLQLFKQSPPFLATNAGLYIAGFTAGVSNGIASIGGMVVALYVLSQKARAANMRATLVMYLFLNLFSWAIWLFVGGFFDSAALYRGLVLAPITLVGVWVGTKLFRPSMETAYKRFCLLLLMSLAILGLFRLMPSL